MNEGEAIIAIRSDIKELKNTMQHVATRVVKITDDVQLVSKQTGVLENRMNRYDSGAKRLEDVTKETETKLDQAIGQNSQILLVLEIAKADRAAEIRTVKRMAAVGAVAFPALMWLIQHGAK